MSSINANTSSQVPRIGQLSLEAADGAARRGRFTTAHGTFETPAFMPVGTQGTVKGLNVDQLRELGAEIMLVNTYHLFLRPGDELIHRHGGIQRFCGWNGPILSDSGGFQIFSLSGLRKVTDDGVEFRSHLDGAAHFFSPERVVKIQENLGVDIMMVLDECIGYGSGRAQTEQALLRTMRWAARAKEAKQASNNLLFGIVQGGFEEDLRLQAAELVSGMDFDGNAIGGLSVGEPPELLHHFGALTASRLPKEKIRYLMGVGTPSDLVRAIGYGIDLFDCVIPTRSARFGRLFTRSGFINLKNSALRDDPGPIDAGCDCYSCSRFSRAYMAHLVHSKEILGVQLATIHNLRFYQRLLRDVREAISARTFDSFSKEFLRSRVDPNSDSDKVSS